MYKYTVKKQKLNKIKNSPRVMCNYTERPKIRHLRRKGYRKSQQRLRHAMLHTCRI